MELEMVAGGGALQLRGAEPYSVTGPTTIGGSIDDESGNLSGLTFATPEIGIERVITSPLPATVFIDASFSQVAPGAGVLTADDDLTVDLSLQVDLHIEVVPTGTTTPLSLAGDCIAAPIDLTMASTAQYDRDTHRVDIASEDFTVPPVDDDPTHCDPLIATQINAELAGGGHAFSLLLEGDLPDIPDGDCNTTTDLDVAPTGESPLGAAVTFTATTATVPSDPQCVEYGTNGPELTGSVDFFRGTTLIGSDELDGSGVATFATTGMPAGTQQLSARFRGNFPFIKSSDGPVEHRVTTRPTVSTTLPSFIEAGTSVEFEYTVGNSQFGSALDDVRTDVTLYSPTSFPTLERWDGASWQPVTLLSNLNPTRFGTLPVFDLASGTERTERLRITADANKGEVTVIFEVKPNSSTPVAAQPTGMGESALGRGQKHVSLYTAERVPSSMTTSFDPDNVWPHTVRQGQTVMVDTVTITPYINGHEAKGYLEYFLEGRRVEVVIWPGWARPTQMQTRVPLVPGGSSGGSAFIIVPEDMQPGTKNITIRYSGDDFYLPSQVTWPFTLLEGRGPSYRCYSDGLPPIYFAANVEAQANIPTAANPGELALGNLAVSLFSDRGYSVATYFGGMINDDGPTAIGEMNLKDIRFTFSGGGTGTATGLTQTRAGNDGLMYPGDPVTTANVDRIIAFDGEAGSVPIAGAVGEVVPITLQTVEFDLVSDILEVPYNVVCSPLGESLLLGQTRISGVDLTVSPEGTARAGQDVTLTADVGDPRGAGVAEFMDGTGTLGVIAVSEGKAVLTTDELEVGDHTLKVRYYPTPAGPVQTSSEMPLTVLPETDCGDFAEDGNAAVVRLVYMELLGRCPDQAGFEYWTGRLDGGTSPEVFARAISRTPEAVGLVVDDAYEAMLGRAADAPGRAFWVERMRTGAGRYDQLLADLASSSEFWALSGSTRAGFVTRVYERLLDRAPDAGGLEYWTDLLAAGTPRRTLVSSLANQPEPLGRLVAAAYDEILGRAPTGSEPSNASSFLRTTGDRSGLYAELIGSPEFTLRAQDFPNFDD